MNFKRSKEATRLEFNRKSIAALGHPKPTREEAKEHGLLFYWTGVPCVHGHLTYRYTKSYECR